MLCNIPDADSLAHGEGTVRIGQNGFHGFICLVAVDNMNIICPFDNGIEIGRFMQSITPGFSQKNKNFMLRKDQSFLNISDETAKPWKGY